MASVASPSISDERASDRSSSFSTVPLQLVEVVVLVGKGVGQLVGDRGLVLVLVEAALLAAQKGLEEPFLLLFDDGGFLDQMHGLGLGVVEGRDLLGVDLDHDLLPVQVAGDEPQDLHSQLVGPELGGGDLLVDLLHKHRFQILAVGHVPLDLGLERELTEPWQELLERLLVFQDRLGRLVAIGQLVPLGEEFLASLDAGRQVIGGRGSGGEDEGHPKGHDRGKRLGHGGVSRKRGKRGAFHRADPAPLPGVEAGGMIPAAGAGPVEEIDRDDAAGGLRRRNKAE